MIPEKEFWNKKYEDGGISGRGSIGRYRNWKWIRIYNETGEFKSVVDVGCGDLKFWMHPIGFFIRTKKGFEYTGIDVSEVIIERNRKIAPRWNFICSASHELQGKLKAQVVLALDLLFHIMDEKRFKFTLENLCKWSNDWVVIYNWDENPFENLGEVTDGVSQYYRNLDDYEWIFGDHLFELVKKIKVPFDDYGMLYFFRKLIY